MSSPPRRNGLRALALGLVLLAAALGAAACGSGGSGSSSSSGSAASLHPVALPASVCGPLIYQGPGSPNVILPYVKAFTGGGAGFSNGQFGVFLQYLEQQHWKAGRFTVGVQKCNSATVSAGFTDPAKCADLAQQFASTASVVAVVAVDSSDCVKTMAPILDRAPGGGLAFTSDAASNPCITEAGKTCQADEPDKYYPTGVRDFFRPIPNDNSTGTAFAQLGKDLGFKKVYVISHPDAYGTGVAKVAQSALKALGIPVAGYEVWNKASTGYRSLMERVKASGADAIYMMGYAQDNAAQVIKDKQAVLGSAVTLVVSSTIQDPGVIKVAGPAMDGALVVQEIKPPSQTTGTTKAFFDAYDKATKSDISAYGPYGTFSLADAELTLRAIADSDGSRAGVLRAFKSATVQDSPYGYPVRFAPTGDLSPRPPAAYSAIEHGAAQYKGEIRYPASLLAQATR